jgi:hypothetical protein
MFMEIYVLLSGSFYRHGSPVTRWLKPVSFHHYQADCRRIVYPDGKQ